MLYNQYTQELHEAYIQHQKKKEILTAKNDADSADATVSADLGTTEHFDEDQVPTELKREILSRFRHKLGGREYRITTGEPPLESW